MEMKACPLNAYADCIGERCAWFIHGELSIPKQFPGISVPWTHLFPAYPCAVTAAGMKALLDALHVEIGAPHADE